MVRSKLRHKYLKLQVKYRLRNIKKQRDLCVNLLKQKKWDYSEALDLRSMTDNTKIVKQWSDFSEVNLM